jgi:5-methylcytosine-specific restriction protein A
MADHEEVKRALGSLRPTRRVKIMDAVSEAGINIDSWAFKADGTPVGNPSANPAYCYEWAFGGNSEPIALCVWETSLTVNGGVIVYKDNLRQFASKLNSIAIEKANPPQVRSRARRQETRAQKFDSLVQSAFRYDRPVRIIVLKQDEEDGKGELGWDASSVQFRALDSVEWHVASFSDESGEFVVVRGAKLLRNAVTPFVDQFSIGSEGKKVEATTTVYERSAEVRRSVLDRAEGKCEYCKETGFRTSGGSLYLETHHVKALSNGGPDRVWNVVAICPDDHRKAHYGEKSGEMAIALMTYLATRHPEASEEIRALGDKFLGEGTAVERALNPPAPPPP